MNLGSLKPLLADEDLKADADKSQVDLFFKHFEEDFIKNPFELNGKKIKIVHVKSNIPKFTNYPETFVHIVHREFKSLHERFYDCHRANRIHWIKPMPQNSTSKKIYFSNGMMGKEFVRNTIGFLKKISW